MANPWDPVPNAPGGSSTIPVPPAVTQPVAPYAPPPTSTSGSNSGYYTGGNPWSTGYPGTGRSGTSGYSAPMMPQFPWQGFNAASEQAQRATEQGLSALTSGMAVKSPFGQQVGNMFASPYGLPPHLLAQQQRMLAETSAGSRANALERSKRSAVASGFGDSMGAIRAQDMIRNQSAADLNNAQTQLAIQDAMMQMQRQQGMGGLMAQLYGMDAGLLGQYAQIQAGRQFPITPTGGGIQGAQPVPMGGGGWWDQSGRYQTQPMPYDPFYRGGAPGTGQGAGYTPQNPWRPW